MKGWVIKLGIRKAIRQEKTVIIALAFTLVLVVLLFPYIWKSPYIEHISFAVLDEDNSALIIRHLKQNLRTLLKKARFTVV